MGKTVLYMILLVAILTLAACGGRVSQQNDGADVTVDLVAESTGVGPTVLEITLTGDNGAPINNATIDVKGDMTHAGMTPVLAEGITDGQEGAYTVPFEWTMAGDWIITVDVTLPDGQSVSRQFELSVSGDMEGMNGQ